MVVSIIQKSQLEGAHRLDAEYYQPEYLALQKNLEDTKRLKKWGEIEGKFITGPFGSEFNTENYVQDGEYRYVRGKDVKDFFPTDEDNVYVPREDYERLKKYSLLEGDILVSVVGTPGIGAIVDSTLPPAVFSCKSTVYRTKSINPFYFVAYLNSLYGRKLLERSVRGAVQTGLNIDDLRNLPVFLPGANVQVDIADLVKNAKKTLDESKSFYSQAEKLLLEELGLKSFEAGKDLSYTVNLSDIKSAHRADAEYFQPKYEKLINLLGRNAKPLGKIAKRTAKRVDIAPDVQYEYIEISDVNVSNGAISSNLISGKELPANAKIKIVGSELLISKVRPTRGAVAIVPDDWNKNFVASGAFSVFEAPSPMREYLQVALRSIIGKLQMEKPTTGTSYPTVTDQDVEDIMIPILPEPIQQKIADLVRKSHEARKKSKELLEEAKRKVEEMIENT